MYPFGDHPVMVRLRFVLLAMIAFSAALVVYGLANLLF